MGKKKRAAAVCPLWLMCLLITACADTAPAVPETSACLIAEYAADGRIRSVRLSVFAGMENDMARMRNIEVFHPESGLVWTIDSDSVLLLSKGMYWRGSGYLFPPHGESFPSGTYRITYTDSAGRTASAPVVLPDQTVLPGAVVFPVGNDSQLAGSFPEAFALVYDSENILLWMGQETDFESGEIKERYPSAASVRSFRKNSEGTAGVLLPPVPLQ